MLDLNLLKNMADFISEDKIHESGESAYYGNDALLTVKPTTEEEIANIIKYANETGMKVNIEGGGTKKGFGGLLDRAEICLSLADYKGIVEHTAGDMTITVKAGTPFNDIQRYLASFRQMIPLDPFTTDKSTIGGVIASNDSGPKRLGYGSARDAVIGMRLAYPDGKIIRAGGKVVKNVAGYDMNKLFIGSMGTLAVMTEITLKLRPLPKYESLALVTVEGAEIDKMREFSIGLLDSMMEPVSFELLNPQFAEKLTGHGRYTFAISLEDVESSVLYQENLLRSMIPAGVEISFMHGPDAAAFWSSIVSSYPALSENYSTLKIGVRNMDVLPVLEAANAIGEKLDVEMIAHGGMGHGICQMYLQGDQEHVRTAINDIRKTAEGLGGYVIVKQLSYQERLKVSVWGNDPSYQFLLQGIKMKIDPNSVLNYKRFVGGI